MKRSQPAVIAILGLGALFIAASAWAGPGGAPRRNGSPEGGFFDGSAGVRISNVVVDPSDFSVDFDVTAFMSSGYPYTTAWLGVYTAVTGVVSVAPAIDFGDGSTIPPMTVVGTGLPQVGTGTYSTVNSGTGVFKVYRGSFSHTYPALGSYSLQANSNCCAGSPGSTVVSAGTLTTVVTTPWYYTYRFQNFEYPLEVAQASILEIPTASTAGLVALGLALLAAGFVVLRRS